MDRVINLRLLKEPLNWVTVGAMIVFVAVSFLVVYSHATSGGSPIAMQKED